MRTNPRGTIYLAGLATGLLAAAVLYLISAKPRGVPIQLVPPEDPAPIRVHINGAVQTPGVYSFPPGSIVQDAIVAAGGAAVDASFEEINLAAPLRDGQLISVPRLSEATPPEQTPQVIQGTPIDKINLNTARESDLERLPGIGPSLAAKIIEFRQQNGPFSEIEDLLLVSGIGASKLEQIKDFVMVR